MAKKRFIEQNGARVCFHIEGRGQVLILLHGFLENMDIFRRFSEVLSKKYRVLLIDLPGHGQSQMQAESHTMELMAESVNAVIEHLEIEKTIMIGHSMGGYVALAFADKYMKKLCGLGTFHSHALADTTEAKINRGRAIQVVKEHHKDFISSFIPDLFTKKNQELLSGEIEELQIAARNIPKESVIASLEGMRQRTDKLKLLNTMRIPMLFIIGKQDPRAPLDKMMHQISLPKHAEVLILDDVAHMGYLENFVTTVGFVDGFVGRICLSQRRRVEE